MSAGTDENVLDMVHNVLMTAGKLTQALIFPVVNKATSGLQCICNENEENFFTFR